MKDKFELAYDFTKEWEGGLVDHPADPGGITNHGISLRFLKSYIEKHGIWLHGVGIYEATPDTIRKLTENQAMFLFYQGFWLPPKCDRMPDLPAIAHFDFCVNGGITQANKTLQRTVGAGVDGIVGIQTLNALERQVEKKGELQVALGMLGARQRFYDALVIGKPDFRAFIKGWTNRVEALRKYVIKLA